MKKYVILCSLFLGFNLYAQEKEWYNKDGIYLGLGTGTWLPANNKNPLKTPVMFNFNVDFKNNKNAIGFSFDLLFLKTKEPLSVRLNDSIINSERTYGGVNITLNYAREFYERNRFSFEAITGLGYGEIGFYNPNSEIDVSKGSFLITPGLNVRYLMNNKYFLQFKLQYNIANYHDENKVIDNLKGQYISAKIIFGSVIN